MRPSLTHDIVCYWWIELIASILCTFIGCLAGRLAGLNVYVMGCVFGFVGFCMSIGIIALRDWLNDRKIRKLLDL